MRITPPRTARPRRSTPRSGGWKMRNSFEYPVSVNGKLRFRKEYAASMTPAEIQADVVTAPEAQKWLEGKTPKKIIVVPGKIINIVI